MKMKIIVFLTIVVCMLTLLFFMNEIYYKLSEPVRNTQGYFILMTLLGLLFGVIIEWKSLFNIIKGRINIDWIVLVPALLLASVCFIPITNWVLWFGFAQPFYIDMLWKPQIHTMLTVLSGILITRALGQE